MPDATTDTIEDLDATRERIKFLRAVQAGDVYQTPTGQDRVRYHNGGGSQCGPKVRKELKADPYPTIYLGVAKVYRLTAFGDRILNADDKARAATITTRTV